jgi:hypothetical protein
MLAGLYGAVLWPDSAYMLLLTAVATNVWYLGQSRALVLSIGVILVAVAFIAPTEDRSLLVPVFKDLPHVVLFIAVVALVGRATGVLRRARADAERHAAELRKANTDLARHMEEVQTISDQLSESNEALEDALVEAERTALRASALQDVTAALSTASTTADIAAAVLTRGMRAMQASRGHLVLVDDGRIAQVIGSVGWSDDTELTLAYSREAMKPFRWSRPFGQERRCGCARMPNMMRASRRSSRKRPMPLVRADISRFLSFTPARLWADWLSISRFARLLTPPTSYSRRCSRRRQPTPCSAREATIRNERLGETRSFCRGRAKMCWAW